jgi:regulator of sigma E protease
MAEIHRHKGKQIRVEVLRRQMDGSLKRVRIEPDPTVRSKGRGQIGFLASETDRDSTLVALPSQSLIDSAKGSEPLSTAAEKLITSPGTRILAINGVKVDNFTQIREALKAATLDAHRSSAASVDVRVKLAFPLPAIDGAVPTEERTWSLSKSDLDSLHALSWTSPLDPGVFEPEQTLLRAEGSNVVARAADAVKMGIAETHRVMMMTYLTFARLFEGTVKIEHLKGPVGIAHIGTRILDRGFIWLLFFMGLISVNLAVVNFLPLPIVDGGQFLFLLAEQIRGKPLPVSVQNAATIAGLLLIGTVFLIVTFQDVVNLFG